MAAVKQLGFDLPKGKKGDDARDRLAERVMAQFRKAKDFRGSCSVMGKSVDGWLNRLERAYHKVHEADEVAERQGMSTYYGLIAQKTNMTASFLRSKYVGFKMFPFSLEATPVVELPEESRKRGLAIVRGRLLTQMMQAGGLPPEALVRDGLLLPEVARFVEEQARQAKEELRAEEFKIAQRAAANMTKLIQDQFSEGNFEEAMSEFVFYLSLYPTAFLALEYEAVEDSRWRGNKFVRETVVRPVFRAINPKNAFPASDASSANDGTAFIELAERSRAQLASFLGNDELGYLDDAIKDVLDNGDGNWLDVDGDNERLFDDDGDLIHVLRCQMAVSGAELAEYGVKLDGGEEANRYRYFNADIEVCNGKVIRVVLVQSPMGRRTYFSASYKKLGRGVWGISPAMMIYDRQLSVNRVHWAMALNANYSAGAMFEINAARFDHPEEVNMRPFSRVFTSPDSQQTGGGIAMHQMRPTFAALFNQMVNEIRLADDECGLPSFLNGAAGLQGAGQTLGGLAMMQDNAVLGLKDCFAIVDMYVIRPVVKLLRDMNLEDGDDPSVRGDAEVLATGLLGLEKDLEKAKVMAGAAPSMAMFAQQQAIPPEMYRSYVRDLLRQQGFDTDKFMPDDVSGSFGDAQMAATPVQSDLLDGRSGRLMGEVMTA